MQSHPLPPQGSGRGRAERPNEPHEIWGGRETRGHGARELPPSTGLAGGTSACETQQSPAVPVLPYSPVLPVLLAVTLVWCGVWGDIEEHVLLGVELPPKGWEGPPARAAAARERPDSGRLGTDGAGGQREGDSSGGCASGVGGTPTSSFLQRKGMTFIIRREGTKRGRRKAPIFPNMLVSTDGCEHSGPHTSALSGRESQPWARRGGREQTCATAALPSPSCVTAGASPHPSGPPLLPLPNGTRNGTFLPGLRQVERLLTGTHLESLAQRRCPGWIRF